ncbi:MAG: hypothetical protein DRJ40_03130 [Thermoprotei archaeon]|nr:MAG: hypothetical protein DRJ40_03130 [Thermoprotei archaeon]
MRAPCEYISRLVIPAIRALVAAYLVKEYKLSQVEIAKKLEVTQPAISYYLHSKRGKQALELLKSDERVMKLVKELAEHLRSNERSSTFQKFICEICVYIRSSDDLFSEIMSLMDRRMSR